MTRHFELDGIERFADRAASYARARPSYPTAAIDYVLSKAPRLPARIVDLGAGTGIATRLLTAKNGRAIALDPGLVMLRSGIADARVPRAAGTAERLPLRDGSVDLLTAFNAFHWFVPEPFFAGAHRALAAGGRLALIWNDWDLDDPFTREFVALMRSGGEFLPEDRSVEVAPLFATKLFPNVETASFANEHVLDAETLPLRLRSISWIPHEGPPWDALADGLRALHARYADGAGVVRHRYRTNVYVAERA